MVPTGKDCPGAWDLLRVGATPESSIAVGSVHVAAAEVLPAGLVTLIAFRGQPVITGAVMSSSGPGPDEK